MSLAVSEHFPDNPLASLKILLGQDLHKVDELIGIHLKSPVPLIPVLSRHLIHAGGKRLRPVLTLAGYRLFREGENEATGLAAAVEFIHTATLLHDDVVDESRLRRGLPSANELWGDHASVLVGDFLFARSFQLMIESGNPEVLRILAAAAARIAEGEVLQMSICHNLEGKAHDLLQVIEAKTAELFAAACQSGALMASHPSDALALRAYGLNLGMAFQVIDDILDYTSHKEVLGKESGDDFREGKITLPVILAYPHCQPSEKQLLKKTLVDRCQTPQDFAKVLQILEKRGGFRESYDLAVDYGKKASQALNALPSHPIKYLLLELIDHCLQRNC